MAGMRDSKESTMKRGAYTHKQGQSRNQDRSHVAGNPRRAVKLTKTGEDGFDQAVSRFFRDRGHDQPSVSSILQTRGVEIGVAKWVKRKP